MHRTISQLSFALIILLILGTSTLFSQVNIKERVEIKPKPLLQKASTQDIVLFAANPDSNQGRHQEGAILVQYPCTITVTASMDVQPGSDGSYPATDLAMFGSSGLIAWYHGYPDGTHGSSGGTATYTASCGVTGVQLWNTMGYDDVTKVTRSIGSSSATITFEGKLLRYWTFTATATLRATIDTRYDLASATLTTDTLRLTRCLSSTSLHTILKNNAGESYGGVPCQNPPTPMTLVVQSSSDVVLSYRDQQGKLLSLSPGDLSFQLAWNYQGETQNSTATVTLSVDGQAASLTLALMARPDSASELGSLAMTASPNSITQCSDGASINITALDRNGQPYTTGSCLYRAPMTISVSPPSKATLVYSYGDSVAQGSTLTLQAGDTPISLQWNYVVGDSGGSVVVSAQSLDKSAQTTVGLTVDPSPLAVTADVTPGEVRSGLKSLINARVVAECGKAVTPPTTTTFKFEVTDGLQWGYLYDPATGKSGTMLDGVKHVQGIASVEYRAYGPEPPEEEDIPLTITASDETIGAFQTDFYVEPNKLRVTAAPNPIHFGESTQWTVEKKERDGTYTAITSNWQTAFQLVEVDTNGYLYSPDSTQIGSTVYGAFQTASYYAKPRQVEPDSVSVSVFVTTVDPNVISVKVSDGDKPKSGVGTNKTKSLSTKVTKAGGSKNNISMDDPPHLGGGQPYYGAGRVAVKKKEIQGCINVTFQKSPLTVSDTTLLNITDGNTGLPIPQDTHLDVTLAQEDGSHGFLLLSDGQINIGFEGVTQPIRYIAPDSISGELLHILVHAKLSPPLVSGSTSPNGNISASIRTKATIEAKGSNTASLKQIKGPKGILIKPNLLLKMFTKAFVESECVVISGDIESEPIGILLGESIYFQAVADPSKDQKLFFNPLKSPSEKHVPALQGAQFTVTKDHGDALGVYYDEAKDENGVKLDPDIIRIVGRYWKEPQPNADNRYVVRLEATAGDRDGEILIEVKKPTKLGDTYNDSKDVHDQPLSIDGKCIEYGGKCGIPPQFIKAQIFREASHNLDGIVGKGFAPTYVYEPYTAQILGGWKADARYNKGMWLVDKTRKNQEQLMGTGKRVPTHLNVQDFAYPREPQTVWDMIVEHSQLVDFKEGFSHTKYGLRNGEHGEMDFYPDLYRDVAKVYKQLLGAAWYVCYYFGAPSGQTGADVSRLYMIKYMRDYWMDVGAQNMTAQTRVASSYGFLQFLFPTAVEQRNYPKYDPNKSPEDLNETDTNFQYGMEYQKKLLQDHVGNAKEKDGNWDRGYEEAFEKGVWAIWNHVPSYPNEVKSYVKNYLPK